MAEKRRILVVDPSKVVRSTLIKHLKDEFDIREENDGESAWQTLVLDASIVAVVAGAHLGRIEGFELLERLRTNRLRRLAEIPFMLVVSQDEPPEQRKLAKSRGVSDFLVRGMPGEEIHQRVSRLVDWEINTDSNTAPPVKAGRKSPYPAIKDSLPALEKMAAECVDRQQSLTLLAFTIERESLLIDRFGAEAINQLGERIAQLIQGKIGQRDRLFHHNGTSYVIASPATSPATCLAFAQRVYHGLGENTLTLNQQRLQIAVCASLASRLASEATPPIKLLEQVLARLEAARAIGGGQVINGDPEAPTDDQDIFAAFKQIMREPSVTGHLGLTGLHLMPLMRLFEQEFHFGLPLKDMEQLFKQRANNEESPD